MWYLAFKALKKEFIATFSKMGLKHEILLQVHGFKQTLNESMRDCENHLSNIFWGVLQRKHLAKGSWYLSSLRAYWTRTFPLHYTYNTTKTWIFVIMKLLIMMIIMVRVKMTLSQKQVIHLWRSHHKLTRYGPPTRIVVKCMETPNWCGVCGGNHPRAQCLPMRSQGGVRQNPHMAY